MKHLYLFALLSLAFLVYAPGSAQEKQSLVETHKTMHHETQSDPYLPNAWKNQKTTPAYQYQMRTKTGSGTSIYTTQVNINSEGENIVDDAANEPSISVSPVDPQLMVIGWRQFDNIASNFRQAGWAFSNNAGASWTFPGVIEGGIFRSDPVLDADAEGKFYYNSLTNDPDYFCKVFGSIDGGQSWDAGTEAHGGDKQWMTIDRTDGPGKGNIYSTWSYYFSTCAPGFFTRSIDYNASYEDCIVAEGNAYWCTMTVGNEGELYIAGTDGDSDSLVIARSITAKDKSGAVTWLPPVSIYSGGSPTGWSGVNPGGLLGQVIVDVDRSTSESRGYVYVLASIQRPSISDPCDVIFLRSTDGGSTWSAPIRINDDESTHNTQWFGTLSVAPNGRIDVIWLDTRDTPDGQDHSALYYSYSTDQGETWSPNERLSELFDSHLGYPNQNKMGDYLDMESDNQAAHLAWAATFNGEQDVYYSRIEPPIATGMPHLAAMNLKVFPNPTSHLVQISGAPVHSQYELCNHLGMTILSGSIERPLQSIDVSKVAAGFYLLRINSADGRSGVVKVVKSEE